MVPMRLLLRSLFSNVHATSVMLRKYGLQNANFSVCIDSYQPLTKFSRSVTRLANPAPLLWQMDADAVAPELMYEVLPVEDVDRLLLTGTFAWRHALFTFFFILEVPGLVRPGQVSRTLTET